MANALVQLPSLVALSKAQRPLGVVGSWKCPACNHRVDWRCDFSREIDITEADRAPVTAADLIRFQWGFMGRVQQEIEQHINKNHPPERSAP